MIRISESRLDYLIAEDVPYIDLTSEVLGIGAAHGKMEYFTREACTVAGVDEAARVALQLGCVSEPLCETGDQLEPGDAILRVHGSAGQLHQAWKVGLNLLDHLSAIATKTRGMVDAVHAVAPGCEVLTTRKSMPGVKDLVTSAILAGGAFPHRLGLSETILVFDNHIAFLGGFEAFLEKLPAIRRKCIEKKLFVEADAEQAIALAQAGVDGIQFDKLSPEELREAVPRIRAIDPRVTLVAAGGINPSNAAEYAATGVDGIVTTSLFTAKPLDMSVRMEPSSH